MSPKRRKFRRQLGERRYKAIFLLSVEGIKTEPQYFKIFDSLNTNTHINCLSKKNKGAPQQVLRHMENQLNEEPLRATDEAWLVVDKDHWSDRQLSDLHDWAEKSDQHGFALSNPKFEYWLLLHFEDGKDIFSSQQCTKKLKQHLPEYDKSINPKQITHEMIVNAIDRAKQKDNSADTRWPETTGSTVYKLAEAILKKSEES